MKIDRNSKLKLQVFIMIIALVLQAVMPAMSSVSIAEPLTTEEAEEQSTEAVDAVKTLIGALPGKGKVTLEDEADIEEAREAYDELTDDEEELLEVEPLETAEAELEELELAEEEKELNSEDIESDDNAVESEEIDESEEEAKHETEKDADKKVDRSELDSNEEEDKKIEDLKEGETEEYKELPEIDTRFMPLMMGLLGTGPNDLGDIFTGLVFEVDEEGDNNFETIPENSNTRIEVGNNTLVRLKYDWELADDVELKDGDHARITIPDAFLAIAGPGLTGNLETDGAVVGTYTIDPTSKVLKVVFNDALEGREDRKGEVWANLKFNETKLNEDANQTISFGGKINKTFEVTAVPKVGDKSIKKSGTPNKTKNADFITWSIDANIKLEELANGSVEDSIPEGLGDPYDFEIIDLKVGFGGTITENGTSSISAAEFPVNLGATSSAYRITYKTKILDHSKTAYNNVATLKDGADTKDTGEFNIGKLEIGSTIEKKGKANKSGTNSDEITWTIDVNKAQLALDNVTIGDEFTQKSGHTLDITDIRIFKINEHGTVQGGDIAGNYSNPTTFPVNLGDLENQAIRIEYDTSIKYDEYKHTDNIFINKATLNVDGTPKGDPVEGTVTVGRETLIEKKGVEGTAYGQPYIDWTLHINKAKHGIIGATVKDHMGEGLELVEDSIKIYEKDTNTPYTTNVVINSTGTNDFEVTLGNINDYYTIKYRTNIINPEKSLANQAELYGDGLKGDGIGIGPDLGIIKVGTLGPEVTVNNSYTKNKDINETVDGMKYDGLNHTEKTMSWKISVNAIKEEVTELTITDTFAPANSMVFLEDTLKVKKGSDTLTKGTDYNLTDNKAGGFVLEFTGSHKPLERAQYDIYYKTSFDPNTVLGETGGTLNTTKNYANTASFVGKTKDVADKVKDITPSDSKNYDIHQVVFNGGKKDGVLNRANRKIDWKVYANALGQDLTGTPFVITDTIGQSISSIGDGKSGQEFDKGSIVLREYSLSKTGTIIPGNTINSDNYTVGYDSDDKLIITFANGVNAPIMLEYTTNIEGISQAKYENSAIITGKNGLEKTYPKDVTYSNHNAFISKAAISATDGKVYTDDEIEWQLEINKSLSDINAGAEITDQLSAGLVYLINSLDIKSTSKTLVEGTDYTFTIANDKLTITFTNPVTEMYTVTYKTAVTAGKGVKIENSASFNGESGSVTGSGDKNYTVQQFSGGTGSGVYRGSIKIVKTDADAPGTKLKDAEFEVYYLLNGTEKQIVKDKDNNETHKTNVSGEILIKGLPLREYHIREVTPPSGYLIDDKEVTKVTLTSVAAEKDVTLPFTNTKLGNAKGSIQFTKKGEGTGADKLQGAEFKLYKDTDTSFNTPIKTETSDIDGLVKFTDVPGGKYVIKETAAPTGYVVSSTGIPAEITQNGQKLELDHVTNERLKGSIEVEKVGSADGVESPLAGAKFGLYDQLATDFSVPVKTATSELSGGKAIAKFTDVPYGTYKIREITAPTGYAPSDRLIENVSITEENEIVKANENDPIINEKATGKIQITKFGEIEDVTLEGAKFDLVDANNNVKYSGTTNNQGILTFEKIAPGTYILKETEAPAGYNLSTEIVENIEITSDSNQELKTIKYNNTRKRGNIEILKRNKNTHNPLKGAKIGVYTEDGNLVEKLITGEDGKAAFNGLLLGKYYYQEKQAPSGYILDNLKYPFDIIENGVTIERELDNTRRPISPPLLPEEPGRVELIKIDSDDSNIKLEGAEFEIKDSNGSVVERITTNANGKATSSSLPMGAYSLVEITAPTAYKLNSIERSFVIDGSGVLIKITIGNEKESEEATDPENPDKPDPEEPTDPENPDKPDPEEPTDPEKPDPTDPTDPEKPTDPKPTEPSNPGGSGGGGGGGGSKDPEKPVDPEKPIDSEDPEKPTDPSVDPENPVEPEEPGKPTEPERPTQPRPIDPIEEETPNNTPKEGKINVPKGATVKPSTPPKNGTVTIDPNGNWKYTPKPGFVGKDRFTITLTYEDGTTEEIEIIINVGDRKPTIIKSSTTKNVPKGGEVEVEKGDRLTITTPATNGSATVTNDGSWKYTPNTDYIGKDVFTITVTSQDGTEGQIIVEMTVTDGLPKTGEASNAGFYLTGLLFISLGLFLRKKKTA